MYSKMRDINATLIISLRGKTEEEVWRGIKYTRRKYVQQAKKSGICYEKANSEEDLKEMYKMHMQILEEGGAVKWTYEKWRKFVEPAGDRIFFIKNGKNKIGCFILSEITKRFFNLRSDEKGIRPLVFANYKEHNYLRPNDFMYWETIKYALDNHYSFIDLGGWQINPRGHLKSVNSFKEDWGGEIVYYFWDYPFLTALRRKLIRNIGFFWWINSYLKKTIGKINHSVHDDYVRDAAARN
jgi:hypothetical protein